MKVPRWARTRRRVGPTAALFLLATVGVLVAIAAPGDAPSSRPATSNQVVALAPHAATTAKASATATQAPHGRAPIAPAVPTDTPAPATPTPVPPTATPTPSWHTVATYSGSSAQTLPSFTTAYPWRLDWTCTPAPATSYSFSFTADGSAIGAFGDTCDGSNPSSGVWASCADASAPCGSHTFAIAVDSGVSSPGAWSATIEEYY